MLKGAIRITQLGYRLYGVAFITRRQHVDRLSWRECGSLRELEYVLAQLGVGDDGIASARRRTKRGEATSIRGLVVDPTTLDRLGLRSSENPPGEA